MGQIVNLEVKQSRHAVEQTMFGLACDTQALARLANDGAPFFATEITEARRLAYDLLAIAQQAETNTRLGTK